jgi:hypothetical protein
MISRKRPRLGWMLALGLMLALGAGPIAPARAAATFFVRTDGSDSMCNGTVNAAVASTPNCAFATIQTAIDTGAAGDTVSVAAGIYGAAVNVNKLLELRGAQAGVDARTRSGAGETIVANTVSLFATGAVVDGFTIRDAVGPGLLAPAFASGYQVINNIIQNNVVGLYLNSTGAAPSLIHHNAFRQNNLPGPASGSAIYSDAGLAIATIYDNTFTGHTTAAIKLVGSAQSQITIANNQLIGDSSIVLQNTSDATIGINTSTNSAGSAIVIAGGDARVQIVGNTITNGAASAVELVEQGAGLNTDIQIVGNTMLGNQYGIRSTGNTIGVPGLTAHFNRIAGNVVAGAANTANAAWDAENNWWGCNYGPGNGGAGCAGMPNGTAGGGGIDVAPWLVLEASATPDTLFTGASAAVGASLTRNSDAVDTTAAGYLPNGTPVGFAGALGSIAPPTAVTNAGQAAATFSAGEVAGAGSASVSVDGQTVTMPITIKNTGTSPSATTIVSSANPSVFGQAVGLVATVSAVPPGTGIPTGTVTFKEGATTLGTASLNAVGQAILSISTLGVGAHAIAAFYSGDNIFSASDTAAAPFAQTVQKADSVTTITLHTPDPSRPGQPVLVLFTVSAGPPGAGAPAGAVTVSDGSATCTSSVAAGSCSITLGAAGARNLTATYAGDMNFNASSGSVTQRVALSVFLPIVVK